MNNTRILSVDCANDATMSFGDKIVFSCKCGNQHNGDYLPIEVVEKYYKDRVGQFVEFDKHNNYIILSTDRSEDEKYLFVECFRK